MWVSNFGAGAYDKGMRTKIDANGTLIDFVAHGEDVCVVLWERVERRG